MTWRLRGFGDFLGDGIRSIAIVLLAASTLGMGALGMGGSGSGVPARNYQGSFVDLDGTHVEAKWVTAGGDLSLAGELGRGDLRISFDDIKTIDFSADSAKRLVAKLTLRKGDPIELKIRPSLAFSGQTSVGAYSIRARDLKSVALHAE